MNEPKSSVCITVNGVEHRCEVPTRLSLVDFLRETLRLTGTHVGCEHGICGACSVILDGDPVRSCLMFAVQADGHSITTVEGLANADGSMSVLQDSFCETHGLQCGYCTPGMLVATHSLLKTNPNPSAGEIRDALSVLSLQAVRLLQIEGKLDLSA